MKLVEAHPINKKGDYTPFLFGRYFYNKSLNE